MTSNMTRPKRAHCWRTVRTLVAATFAISSIFGAACAMAQVKAPPKNQLKKSAPRAAAPSSTPSEDVQAFSIAADSNVVQQLIILRVDPTDAQAAADAVSKRR